jgi:hypothetical protein
VVGAIAGVLATGGTASGATMPMHGLWHSHPFVQLGAVRNQAESTNWSGYAESRSASSISAQWTVPQVSATPSPAYSADWIGIDGYSNSDLIQTGTESDAVNGGEQYDAWTEILPAPETERFAVSPGDQMSASITELSSGTWQVTISDTTSGRGYSADMSYSGPADSAEWIVERPEVNGTLSNLANFGTTAFSNAVVNGAGPALTSSEEIVMVSSSGTPLATPSAPSSSGNAFSVAYNGAGGSGGSSTTTSLAPTTSSVASTTSTVAPTTSTVAPTTSTVAPTTSTVAPTTTTIPRHRRHRFGR